MLPSSFQNHLDGLADAAYITGPNKKLKKDIIDLAWAGSETICFEAFTSTFSRSPESMTFPRV